MTIRRSSRSLVMGLPLVGAAALVALGAAQTPAAPGRRLGKTRHTWVKPV